MKAAPLLLLFCVCVANASNTTACTLKHGPGIHKIEHEGRFFLLLVPEGLSTSKRSPVVVDVPGYSESPYYQVALTGIMGFLESNKWIGTVPFGTASTPTSTCCPSGSSKADCEAGKTLDKSNPCSFNAGSCCGAAPSKNSDDVSFARSMVEYTVKNMCGDDTNAFATGFSNGGMMSNRLGCQAADLFKAIAPVAGNIKTTGMLQPNSNFKSCQPSKPVSWISLCGAKDSVCNSDLEKTADEWARHNKCNVRSGPSPSYNTETTHCYKYAGCEAKTEYCVVDDLAHEWPGRMRPDGTSPPQPKSNVDATAFIFEKFASLVA